MRRDKEKIVSKSIYIVNKRNIFFNLFTKITFFGIQIIFDRLIENVDFVMYTYIEYCKSGLFVYFSYRVFCRLLFLLIYLPRYEYYCSADVHKSNKIEISMKNLHCLKNHKWFDCGPQFVVSTNGILPQIILFLA